MKIGCKFQILVYVVTFPRLRTTNMKVGSMYEMMCRRISEVFARRVHTHPEGFWELLS